MYLTSLDSFLGRLVHIKYKNPTRTALNTDKTLGRIVKVSKHEPDLFLIANPECIDLDEVSLVDSNFKWGSWVYLGECELTLYVESGAV